jgi:hypothetical protein
MEANDKTPQRGHALGVTPARQSLVRPRTMEAPVGKADPGPERADREREREKKKKKKDTKDKARGRGVETMFRTSYRTHVDMSALADSKANIMISINGIIMSILLGAISARIDSNPWLLLPTTVMLIGCLVSMIYAVLAARPRVSRRVISLEDVRRNAANILFFGNFVSMPEHDYITGMNELLQDTDRLYTTMIRDIYSLGSVLERKFRLLRTSYTVFMFGLIAGVVFFIIVYARVVLFGAPTTAGAPI